MAHLLCHVFLDVEVGIEERLIECVLPELFCPDLLFSILTARFDVLDLLQRRGDESRRAARKAAQLWIGAAFRSDRFQIAPAPFLCINAKLLDGNPFSPNRLSCIVNRVGNVRFCQVLRSNGSQRFIRAGIARLPCGFGRVAV